ncbi:MAG: glycosyltransferase [Chloroflexota bacterium]
MFGAVSLQPRAIGDYVASAGERACREVVEMGRSLRGLRVLHLTALGEDTRTVGLLRALVPLLNSVGVAAEWQVVPGPAECGEACDALYKALARGQRVWTRTAHAGWLRYADAAAALLDREYDFVIVHDPQPLPLLTARAAREGARPAGRWVWHCHLDLTDVRPDVWGALRPHLLQYDAAIYQAHEYVREDAGIRRVVVVPPVIDPLSPRNAPLAPDQVELVLRRYALDPRRPLLCQVGPLRDTDAIGLLGVFETVKRQVPGLQLAIVADAPGEEREARGYFNLVAERMRQGEDARLLSPLNGAGDLEAGAVLTAATIVAQRAVRRGFAPGLLEAMWKGKAVVGGRSGGIPLQVGHNKTGLIADTPEAFGLSVLNLIENPETRAALGHAARERVRRNQLVTRCLRDYLALFQSFG